MGRSKEDSIYNISEFRKEYNKYREFVEENLNSVLTEEFPEDLYAPMRYALFSGGKKLRPVMVLLSCKSVGGNFQDALYGALAVEIMHNFTLVHDDIMDNDHLRRGKPTVFKKWDVNTAILAGDGLMSFAFKVLAKIDHPGLKAIFEIFSGAILTICEGQALDKEFEKRGNVTADEYTDMIHRKTAILFATCCRIGGIIGNANETVVSLLNEFGINLGLAFQIQDDLLDIISDEETFGKDIFSDIVQGKKSFPLILLERELKDTEKDFYTCLKSKNTIEKKEIFTLKELLAKYDIIERCKNEIERKMIKAQKILKDAALPSADDLIKLSRFILNRDH